MIALGIVLVVLSGAFALGVALSNTSHTQAEAFGVSLSNVTLGGLFLAGVATGAVLLLGLALMLAGGGRKSRRRRAAKAEVKGVRTERAGLADENARLQEELVAERGRAVSPAAVAPAGSDPYPTRQDEHTGDRATQGQTTGEHPIEERTTREYASGRNAAVREDVETQPRKRSGLFHRG